MTYEKTKPAFRERVSAAIRDFLLKTIISQIGGVIFGLLTLGGLSALATQILSLSAYRIFADYPILVFTILLSCSLWILFSIYHRVLKKKFVPYFPEIETSYKFFHKEIIHDCTDETRENVIHTRKYHIKILQNGIDGIRDYYWWTAGEVEEITCNKNGYTVTQIPRTSNMDEILIGFPHPFKKGDEIEFDVIWKLKDNKKSLPYISSKIRVPMDKLTITTIFHRDLKIAGANPMICYERQHVKEVFPFRPIDTNSCIKWEVQKPKFFYLYKLGWRWN